MQLADLRNYAETQARIDQEFRDARKWTRKSLVNIARAGKFSSDRTIQEYCSKIWNISK
jgi:starch phosphorylase